MERNVQFEDEIDWLNCIWMEENRNLSFDIES